MDTGRVLMNIGGASAGLAAFDAGTGKTLWTVPNQEASYSSPVGATIAGRRSAIFLTRSEIAGLDPATKHRRDLWLWISNGSSAHGQLF